MSSEIEEHAAFFRWVHGMTERPGSADADDVRRHARSQYPQVQRVASATGAGLPRSDEFREVRCLDLSAGGISFLTDDVPADGKFVVALGTSPDLIYLSAEVVRDVPQRLVGCRFTGRLRPNNCGSHGP
jgi:hypothetical protein